VDTIKFRFVNDNEYAVMKVIFDTVCRRLMCINYYEWEKESSIDAKFYSVNTYVSCYLEGPSGNIDVYPIACPHKKELDQHKKETEQAAIWRNLTHVPVSLRNRLRNPQ
jgi:cell fate regulator YaaT (PSP1 superfamily)